MLSAFNSWCCLCMPKLYDNHLLYSSASSTIYISIRVCDETLGIIAFNAIFLLALNHVNKNDSWINSTLKKCTILCACACLSLIEQFIHRNCFAIENHVELTTLSVFETIVRANDLFKVLNSTFSIFKKIAIVHTCIGIAYENKDVIMMLNIISSLHFDGEDNHFYSD